MTLSCCSSSVLWPCCSPWTACQAQRTSGEAKAWGLISVWFWEDTYVCIIWTGVGSDNALDRGGRVQERRKAFLSPGACVCVRCFSPVWLFMTPWTVAHQAPLSMVFSRQEYWNGLPFSSPGDLPNSGIESGSPALQADSLSSEPQ